MQRFSIGIDRKKVPHFGKLFMEGLLCSSTLVAKPRISGVCKMQCAAQQTNKKYRSLKPYRWCKHFIKDLPLGPTTRLWKPYFILRLAPTFLSSSFLLLAPLVIFQCKRKKKKISCKTEFQELDHLMKSVKNDVADAADMF